MEKKRFLTIVAEVMKGMISYETMMSAIQRSCMRPEAENLALMAEKDDELDAVIADVAEIRELRLPEDLMDILVLRYLRNTQFLANIPEEEIDISGIEGGDLGFWRKTMLYKVPENTNKISEVAGD